MRSMASRIGTTIAAPITSATIRPYPNEKRQIGSVAPGSWPIMKREVDVCGAGAGTAPVMAKNAR